MFDVVEVGTALNTAASTTLTVTVPTGMTIPVGSVLFIACAKNTTGTAAGTEIADSKGNAYGSSANPGFNSTAWRLAEYRTSVPTTVALVAGDTITYTPGASSSMVMQVVWVRWTAPNTGTVGSSGNQVTSTPTTGTSGTMTPVEGNVFAVYAYGGAPHPTFTPPTGYTQAGLTSQITCTSGGTDVLTLSIAYAKVKSVASLAVTCTLGSSQNSAGFIRAIPFMLGVRQQPVPGLQLVYLRKNEGKVRL